VRIVGVDLAWAERNRTGLCLVEAGCVVDSAVAGDDEEIIDWIEERAASELVVAFDAPLVVRNRDGCRGCERVIAATWGRAHAGCHPANRRRPWFRDGGRARRLARRLRLTPDPAAIAARPTRVAIEVYPHTALVSLFRLPVVLKYKAGRRRVDGVSTPRTVDDRRQEFRRLLNCLLALTDRTPSLVVTTSAGWRRLVAGVDRAKTGADLDIVEDELDAYVCAYVGLHYRRWHGTRDCAVIGDARRGYVVTPVDEARWDRVRIAARRYEVSLR
jgi:predicted RNase H-like nuclease